MERMSKNNQRGSALRTVLFVLCAVAVVAALVVAALVMVNRVNSKKRAEEQREMLSEIISESVAPDAGEETPEPEPTPEETAEPEPTPVVYEILDKYEMLYDLNNDMIGWLKIDDTLIDYPVVKTPEDEGKYLYLNFSGEYDINGTLIMDTDSIVGVGTKELEYKDGFPPSTNLIIHGHTMRSGEMFGNLARYESQDYGMAHNIIQFDSLFEHREYELISCFYTQVYYPTDNVFKFYQFFQADTQEEFDYWYDNIKALALYDTGVTAEFGDEFITLSCCSYQVEDGRFVVIGKRIV